MGWTEVFLLAIVLSVGLKVWLAGRQIRHVAANRLQVPAEFAGQISLQAHQKAADYTIEKVKLGMINNTWQAVIVVGFTLMGGIDYLQSLLSAHISGIWLGLALIASIALIVSVLDIPLSYYKQFVTEVKFGFNRMTKRLFFTDLIRGTVVGALLGGPLVLAVLALTREAGETWWLWAWALWFGFSLALMWLFPTYIAPLFNKFTPLEDSPTRSRILDLLKRCGFDSDGLFVMDGSKRSSHGNAYFSGMGKAKRIVFFDTLLERLNADQIEAVLAHELGHFKKKHIRKHLLVSGLSSLVMFGLLGYLMDTSWFYTGLGVTPDLNNGPQAAALVLFMLALPYFTFPARPVMSWLSRQHEFEADAYAAQQSNADHLISALVKLYEDNASTLTPDALHSAFYDSHPPAAIRIAHLRQLEAKPA